MKSDREFATADRFVQRVFNLLLQRLKLVLRDASALADEVEAVVSAAKLRSDRVLPRNHVEEGDEKRTRHRETDLLQVPKSATFEWKVAQE